MTQKIDAAQWTGLSPDLANTDVREAQNPIAHPQELAPKTYHKRLINWSDAVVLLPIGIPVALALGADTSESVKIIAILFTMTILPSMVKWAWRRFHGNLPAVKMDQAGLHFPYAFKDPIPWSKVGSISFTYGPAIGWVNVALDPQHRVEREYPWPLNRIGKDKQNAVPHLEIISCWDTLARGEELIASLEQFRDNYCAAPSASHTPQ